MATPPHYPAHPTYPASTFATATTIPLPTQPRPTRRPPLRRRPSLPRDIYRGAVRGDFARDLGLAGALTQVALGYCPGLGTLCATRDLLADLHHRDRLGALLNGLALLPIFGGFSKTVAVLHHTHQIGRALTTSSRPHHVLAPSPRPRAPSRRRARLTAARSSPRHCSIPSAR